MKLSYRYELDRRELLVFDDAVLRWQIRELDAFLTKASFARQESDTPETLATKTFAFDFDPEKFSQTPIYAAALKALTRYFPAEKASQKLERSYCNLNFYGDMVYPHRDCATDSPSLSVLYYANAHWEKNWAGETTFFNDAGDSVFAIAPRPGRMVIFRGAIEHRTGNVSRDCHVGRLTIALKFFPPKRKPRAR